MSIPLTDEQIEEVRSGKKWLWIYGEIIHSDQFNYAHFVTYRFWGGPNGFKGGHLGAAPFGNTVTIKAPTSDK
jgi:hypothetical protein